MKIYGSDVYLCPDVKNAININEGEILFDDKLYRTPVRYGVALPKYDGFLYICWHISEDFLNLNIITDALTIRELPDDIYLIAIINMKEECIDRVMNVTKGDI